MFFQLFLMVVSYYIQQALAPKPQAPQAATLGDFNAPTAEEGREIPVIFGTVWVKDPNMIWYGDLKTTAIKTKSGKK